MRTLEWTPRALADLRAIGERIAADKPSAATKWLAKLVARAEAAAFMPSTGHVVPEFARKDLREVHVKNYRIVYRVLPQSVQVLTVFEGHQLLLEEPDTDS